MKGCLGEEKMIIRHHRVVSVVAACLFVATVGCGTGFNDALYQTAGSLGRVTLDIFLTELANRLAESFDQDRASDGADDDTGGDADDGGGGGADQGDDDLVGDAAAGEVVYTTGGCAGCHCDDASGGCALDSPALVGSPVEVLDETLLGDVSHPVKPAMSGQDLVDLEAYLGSL